MAVDERARHELYGTLERTLGPDATGTLMSLLPPVGWADVATKQDLEALGHRFDARIADLRADLKSDMAANQRQLLLGMTGAMLTMVGLVWAALTLA